MPVVTTPPPPRTAAAQQKTTTKQNNVAKARINAVNGLWQLAGFGFVVTGNLADAGAISKHGPDITTEIVSLAETDEKIAATIDRLAAVGPYGALLTATLPLIVQILVNHDRMRAGPSMSQMGVVPKAALEAEMRRQIAEAEQQALQMQQEAEEKLRRLKEELAESGLSLQGIKVA